MNVIVVHRIPKKRNCPTRNQLEKPTRETTSHDQSLIESIHIYPTPRSRSPPHSNLLTTHLSASPAIQDIQSSLCVNESSSDRHWSWSWYWRSHGTESHGESEEGGDGALEHFDVGVLI